MAHLEQQLFVERCRDKFPQYFARTKVLECGSLIVNGTVRNFFKDCDYTGVDAHAGSGVDCVSLIHKCTFAPATFDAIICCEMLEHDEFWQESLRSMFRFLKPGGLLIITAAAHGRAAHGEANWASSGGFYDNLTFFKLIRAWIEPEHRFSEMILEYDGLHHDLYFAGIKRHSMIAKESC